MPSRVQLPTEPYEYGSLMNNDFDVSRAVRTLKIAAEQGMLSDEDKCRLADLLCGKPLGLSGVLPMTRFWIPASGEVTNSISVGAFYDASRAAHVLQARCVANREGRNSRSYFCEERVTDRDVKSILATNSRRVLEHRVLRTWLNSIEHMLNQASEHIALDVLR